MYLSQCTRYPDQVYVCVPDEVILARYFRESGHVKKVEELELRTGGGLRPDQLDNSCAVTRAPHCDSRVRNCDSESRAILTGERYLIYVTLCDLRVLGPEILSGR